MVTSLRRMPEADMKIKQKAQQGFESYKEYTEKGQAEMGSTPSVLSASALSVTKHRKTLTTHFPDTKCTTMMLFVKKISKKKYNVEYATLDRKSAKNTLLYSYPRIARIIPPRGMINKEAIDKMKQSILS